ncbi:hypothetical protein Vafri_17497, partial [Volvox africanus]
MHVRTSAVGKQMRFSTITKAVRPVYIAALLLLLVIFTFACCCCCGAQGFHMGFYDDHAEAAASDPGAVDDSDVDTEGRRSLLQGPKPTISNNVEPVSPATQPPPPPPPSIP